MNEHDEHGTFEDVFHIHHEEFPMAMLVLSEGKQYILQWWFIVMSHKLFKRESVLVVMLLFMVQNSCTKLRLVVYPLQSFTHPTGGWPWDVWTNQQ